MERVRGGEDAVPGIGLVILAAGASVRMGVPKQLLTFRGRSLLRTDLRHVADCGANR